MGNFTLSCIHMLLKGRQESVETVLAALEVVPEPYKSMASTLVEICAYAG